MMESIIEKDRSTLSSKSKYSYINFLIWFKKRKVFFKKKKDGDSDYKLMGSKVLFETPDAELLSRVRQQIPETNIDTHSKV